MVIEVKDIKVGDEIIISSNGNLKYLKVLRPPMLNGKLHWRDKTPLYRSVYCSMRKDTKSYNHTWGGINKDYYYDVIVCTPEEHNKVIYQDLNSRTIWLVKREEI
jgi:hypothetical protein